MPMKIVPKKKNKSKQGSGGMDIGRPAKTKEIPMSRSMSLIKKEPAIKGYLRGGSVKKASGSIKKARMVIPMQSEKAKEKKKTTKNKSSGASPFIMPGQKKMLDRMTGKSKPQTLKGGGLVGGQKKLDKNNDGKITGQDFKLLRSSKGMKKGGKVMKMRGGGAATRGLMFNNR